MGSKASGAMNAGTKVKTAAAKRVAREAYSIKRPRP